MTRVLSGAVLLCLAIAAVWFASSPLFFLIAEALLILGCVEYAGLARASRIRLSALLSTIAAVLTTASFAESVFGGMPWIAIDTVLMLTFIAVGVSVLAQWREGSDAVASVSAALLPVLYLGMPIGSMVAIRESRGGETLFLLMLTVVVSDTAQYYSGRAFGRRPLAPTVSPKKTIEGAIGGFVFGALVMTIAGSWWLPDLPIAGRGLLGAVIVALGILGDLFESMLKRSAGVKDSSTLIPGHGGVLDRIDALLFAAPLYYLVLKYV